MNENCSFKSIRQDIVCANDYWNFSGRFELKECLEDISANLKNTVPSNSLLEISQKIDENHLILLRCGIDIKFLNAMSGLKICAKHRASLGLNWKSAVGCCNPNHSNVSNRKVCDHKIQLLNALELIKLSSMKLIGMYNVDYF
jgi:hypothetical protein